MNSVRNPSAPELNNPFRNLGHKLAVAVGTLAATVALAPAALADYKPSFGFGQPNPDGLGEHKTAAILVNFKDNPQEPFSAADTEAALFTAADSVNNYFETVSLGRLSLTGKYKQTGDVYDWVTVPSYIRRDCSDKNQFKIGPAANRLIEKTTGKSLSGYDNYLYIFPRQNNCINPNTGGVVNGSTSGNVTFINARNNSNYKGVYVHELGHQFGLSHATDARCVDREQHRAKVPLNLSKKCVQYTYGDPTDPMGKARLVPGQPIDFSAINKARLGWIDDRNILTVTKSTVVDIVPDEIASDQTQLVRVPYAVKDGQPRYAYLDYRQPVGEDAKLDPGNPLFQGVAIREGGPLNRFEPTKWQDITTIIDTKPHTKTMGDAPLTTGRSYHDQQSGITISTLSTDSQGARVKISLARD